MNDTLERSCDVMKSRLQDKTDGNFTLNDRGTKVDNNWNEPKAVEEKKNLEAMTISMTDLAEIPM